MGCEPFFNTTGQLNEECLQEFLQEDINKVVGWYHYRYNFKLTHNSFRDRNLHIGLSKYFSHLNNLQKQENFLFFLMVTTKNDTHATHKFKHVLYRKGKEFKLKPLSFRVNNLGADVNRPDGSDYKPTPQQTSCQSDSFEKVYDLLRSDLRRVSGAESVQLIEKSAERFLAKLVPEVNKTDKIVTQLSEQLFEMRHKYLKKRFENYVLNVQMEQCSVDVNAQPASPSLLTPSLTTKPEPLNPESPRMINLHQMSPSSSNIKMATKKNLKRECNEEKTRDPLSSERETCQIKIENQRSPQDIDDNKWKLVPQRRDEYRRASSFDTRNVRKSPDYGSKNS